MSDLEFEKAPAGGLAIVADEIFNSLAAHFPVCMSSDEFHFFPQFKSEGHDWSSWDDFSPDGVAGAHRRSGAGPPGKGTIPGYMPGDGSLRSSGFSSSG